MRRGKQSKGARVVRLSRAQQQELTRAAVLASARAEFAAYGFAGASVDRIAARAELTRGAVYANFATKRALYLAVLLDLEDEEETAPMENGLDLADAVEAFARVWLERLPLTSDAPADARLRLRSLSGVFATASRDDGASAPSHGDHHAARSDASSAQPGASSAQLDAAAVERGALAGVARLEGLMLALALESRMPGRRLVRLAEVVRTLLDGACHLAEVAPGVGDPFDVVRACRHLASLEWGDVWDPPHLPFVAAAERDVHVWDPPDRVVDLAGGGAVDLRRGDGLVVVLGTGRLGAAEEAVRSGEPVTLAVVTGRPAELGRLVRLRVTDLAHCLRRVVPDGGWAPFRLVVDDAAAIADALGIAADDQTEAAVRVRGRHIVARAKGRGAALAVANTKDEP